MADPSPIASLTSAPGREEIARAAEVVLGWADGSIEHINSEDLLAAAEIVRPLFALLPSASAGEPIPEELVELSAAESRDEGYHPSEDELAAAADARGESYPSPPVSAMPGEVDEALKQARLGLSALYIEVPESVARDVQRRCEKAFTSLQASLAAAESRAAELERERDEARASGNRWAADNRDLEERATEAHQARREAESRATSADALLEEAFIVPDALKPALPMVAAEHGLTVPGLIEIVLTNLIETESLGEVLQRVNDGGDDAE